MPLLLFFHISSSSHTNLAHEELRCRTRSFVKVGKVRGGNGESTRAHQITHGAEHLYFISGIRLDAAIVLLVLRVSKKHNALDLGANGLRELGNCASDDGSTLTILCIRKMHTVEFGGIRDVGKKSGIYL